MKHVIRPFCATTRKARSVERISVLVVVLLVVVVVFSSALLPHNQNSLLEGKRGLPSAQAGSVLPSEKTVSNASAIGSYSTVSNIGGGIFTGGSGVPAFYSGVGIGGGYSFGSYNTLTGMKYPMVFPYSAEVNNTPSGLYAPIFQNVSTYVNPLLYQGGSQYEASFATSLHYVANFTRIYPPAIDYSYGGPNPSGGAGPNYSLQFNIPFFSTIPGATFATNWYQSAFGVYTVIGAGDSQDSNASYYLMPNSEWWSNYTSDNSQGHLLPYSTNYSSYNNFFVNPRYPLIISSWVNISYSPRSLTNGSVFINESDGVTGFLAKGYQSDIPYSEHRYRTVWFNTSFEITKGSRDGVDSFPAFLAYYPDSGIAFVGSGNGQSVWGNYTATFGVAQDVGGTLLPMPTIYAMRSATGEASEGDEGVVISGEKTNPVGMPAYFPYTYNSNQSGGPLGSDGYNFNHESMGSSLIVGSVFPSNAGITAYSVYTHSYIAVVVNGSSFYVDFPGLYGMSSREITVGLSLDYWSPIILNFSSPGFSSHSVTIAPYHEQNPFFEVRSVQVVLAPANQKMVYGVLSFPVSYFSYFAGNYIFSHFPGIGKLYGSIYPADSSSSTQAWELLDNISRISANVSSYFWLNVTGGSSYYNESLYLPDVAQVILDTLWGQDWSGFTGLSYQAYFGLYYSLLFNNSVDIPYYVLVPSSTSSIDVSAPILLSAPVSVPSGSGAFEENISLGSFDVPVTFDFPSIPVTYNGTPPSISSISMDGKVLWNGSSTNASMIVDVPLGNIAASNVTDFIYSVYNNSYTPAYTPSPGYSPSWMLSLPSFYYNASFTITPSSSKYAPVNMSRNMMFFNYSLYALAIRSGENPASTTQAFPFKFSEVQVGVGGSYYSVVKGYLYGTYNLTGQRFVLGGVAVQFFRDGILVDSVVTGSNGYYSSNMSFAPASVWGSNATVSVDMQAADMQFTNFSGVVYLHANKVEWYNASMVYITTINILGYGVTIPGWFVNDVLTLLLGWTDAGIYVVVLYFSLVGGIGVGAGTAGGAVMGLIMKKMLKTGVSKGRGAAKGVANQTKPGNK